MHESHVFELQVETNFEVCDPHSFLTLLLKAVNNSCDFRPIREPHLVRWMSLETPSTLI